MGVVVNLFNISIKKNIVINVVETERKCSK